MQLYISTRSGLVKAERQGVGWQTGDRLLPDHKHTGVVTTGHTLLAGTTDGIFRSTDGGDTWAAANSGLTEKHIRWLAVHPDEPRLIFAGTEPAAIFVSGNGGETWEERPEVAALRENYDWFLPYSPEAGCVRGFAFHGARGYAAVEVGAALRTDDRGKSWRLAGGSDGQPRFGRPQPGRVHPDVHSIAVYEKSADFVFAPTGGGFYRSLDGGDSWEPRYANCYARAVWVDPADPDHIVLGPSNGPSGDNGRIEITTDGGQNWERVAGPWNRNMVERFAVAGDMLIAVMANGNLLASTDRRDWSPFLEEIQDAEAVAVGGVM